MIRTLLDIDLREISPVTWPAYNQTSVAVRSAESVGITLVTDDTDASDEVPQAKPDNTMQETKLKLLTVEMDD